MIFNLFRTILELRNYLENIRYPLARMFVYFVVSIGAGVLLSNSSRASELPALTVIAILFGFTINAVVMLGNSSEHYLRSDGKHSGQLKDYYEKSLHISIHTLGIGLLTIVVTGLYRLFPDTSLILGQIPLFGSTITIDLISAVVYTFIVYYIIIFTIVIASTAELVKIRI